MGSCGGRRSLLFLDFWFLILIFDLVIYAVIGSKADYLKVRTWFPDNPEMEVIPGKLTTAIIGVRNVGDGPINITAAMGGLALVSNPEGSVYNFSAVVRNRSGLSADLDIHTLRYLACSLFCCWFLYSTSYKYR